jgi:CheY-like chemotaxis protein
VDRTIVILMFAVVVVLAGLLWRSQSRGGGGEASFAFGELFKASIRLEPQNTQSAQNAVQRAADEKGEPSDSPLRSATTTTTRLARILWVDDLPDGNLYETIALERFGRFVTKATSTEAALRYLAEMDFALIITDVARGDDAQAGENLIRRVRGNGRSVPIMVYTMGAAAQRRHLLDVGADAVVDAPDELVDEVNARISAVGAANARA